MGMINSDYPWYFLPSFNENFNNIWLSIHRGDYPNKYLIVIGTWVGEGQIIGHNPFMG